MSILNPNKYKPHEYDDSQPSVGTNGAARRQAAAEEIASPILKAVSHGQTASAHMFLARSLCYSGRYSPALDEVDAALRENPELAAAHCLKGMILAFRADYAGAAECLENAIRLAGEDEHLADYWVSLARVRMELGEPEAALAAIDRGLQVDPNKASAHLQRGEYLSTLNRSDEAADAYRAALSFDPLLSKARYKLASHLLKDGREDESLQQAVLALRLEPSDPNTRISLGNIYFQLERFEEAIKEYQAAVRLAPPLGQALPLAKIGQAHLKLGEAAEAIAVFRASLQRDPKQFSCYLDLAGIHERDGHYDAAVELLEAAIKVDPRFPHAAEELERVRKLAAAQPPLKSPKPVKGRKK